MLFYSAEKTSVEKPVIKYGSKAPVVSETEASVVSGPEKPVIKYGSKKPVVNGKEALVVSGTEKPVIKYGSKKPVVSETEAPVVRNRSDEPSVKLGPIFLYFDSNWSLFFPYFVPSWWLILPFISAIIGIILFICVISEYGKTVLDPLGSLIFWCLFCCFFMSFPIVVHSMLPGAAHKIITIAFFSLNLLFFYYSFFCLYKKELSFRYGYMYLRMEVLGIFFFYSLLLIGFMIFRIGFFN